MIIIDANEFGQPLDSNYMDLFLKSHRFYNGETQKITLFDDFWEWKEFMDENYPSQFKTTFEWNVPSNATIVEHKEYGLPVDDKWLNYPRFFRGDILFVFNTIEEFDQYIAERTDTNDYS